MNNLTVAGFILSGITIVTLATKLDKTQKQLDHARKVNKKLFSYSTIASKLVKAQLDNLDGQDMMLPRQLVTDIDAYLIFENNDM